MNHLTPRSRLPRIADAAFRRPRRALAAWVAALASIAAIAPALAGEFDASYATPGSESAAAAELIEERFPGAGSGDTVEVVWQDARGARAPTVMALVERMLDDARRLDGVGAAGEIRVAPEGTIAMTSLQVDRPGETLPAQTAERLLALADRARAGGVRVELGGAIISQAQQEASPEAVGLAAAAAILLVAFGSVVAAGLPIVVALFGLGISASLIAVLAGVATVPDWAMAVAGLIGIGVGVDYALLILTRFRGARAAGRPPREANVEAIATAGRSVLVAGGTVIVALLGLFLVGVPFLNGVALAAGLAVLVVMAAAVTLLPALLALLGRHLDRLPVPGLRRAREGGSGEAALRWSRAVQRRPRRAAVVALAVLVALSAPVVGLRVGFPDTGNDPAGTTSRAAYDLIATGFGPGANGPLLVAADLRGSGGPGRVEALPRALREVPGVAAVGEPVVSPAGDAAMLTVVPAAAPQDERTEALVADLRDEALPAALAHSGISAQVGGLTASLIDQSDLVASRLPLFMAAVLGLAFVLLLVAFRAPVVALTAALMNLLSVGAAYGVLSLVSRGGWVGGLIGIDAPTPVPAAILVMMFAILFGLSMDYEVFLLSRIREEVRRHGDTARGVAAGLAHTARVITAAAAIMVAVFSAFVFTSEVFLQMMGVGMAVAILVDATLIRMVLVPAVMQLLGRANWWTPGALERLIPAGHGTVGDRA